MSSWEQLHQTLIRITGSEQQIECEHEVPRQLALREGSAHPLRQRSSQSLAGGRFSLNEHPLKVQLQRPAHWQLDVPIDNHWKPTDMPQPYLGSSRRLVIAFDVGTTFSGSSYCFLEPGEVPKIYSVTR